MMLFSIRLHSYSTTPDNEASVVWCTVKAKQEVENIKTSVNSHLSYL